MPSRPFWGMSSWTAALQRASVHGNIALNAFPAMSPWTGYLLLTQQSELRICTTFLLNLSSGRNNGGHFLP